MSIYMGNIPNETINDNRLNFNSYVNSNVIYINTDFDSHPNALINFKNDFIIGMSNSMFILNKNNFSIFTINNNRTYFNNDVFLRSNLNTSNNSIVIHSNLILRLYNQNNNFIISDNINNSNNQLLSINTSNIRFNINNSNKILITSNSINMNENLIINSNNYLFVNNIKSISPNTPVVIENIRYNTLDIIDNIAKGSFGITNDIIYNKPSMVINRLFVNYNIIEIYNSNLNLNNKTKVFSINSNGFINIGSNISDTPLNINIGNNSNYPIIFNYTSSNDRFTINNRGYIGIGTANPLNYLNLIIKDDNRNIINYPIIKFDLSYNSNLNYRTNNLITLRYIATSNILPIYDDIDRIINYTPDIKNNFIFNFNSQIVITNSSINPPVPEIRKMIAITTLNNDYIITTGTSNIVSYIINSYLEFDDINKIGNIKYKVEYSLRCPRFLTIDLNEIGTSGNRINPNGSFINNNIYQIEYTNYIINPLTTKPYNLNNFMLKEEIYTIYDGSLYNDSLSIRLKQRLYIERGVYELPNFTDSITYIYQPPSDLIYATSNNVFSASLTSDGRLSLGDMAPVNNYQLYVDKKTRLNNLECLNFSSIPERKNINFSYCNISNINKSFINSNICSYIDVKNGFFSNITISNLNIPQVNINRINTSNLTFDRLVNCNITIDSNIFNSRIKMIIGSGEYDQKITSNFILDINLNSNNNNGLGIFSFYNNTNPSLIISGFSNFNYPIINLNNLSNSYSINMNNDNYNLINNNSNFIYKHNYNQNLFVIGNSNNAIFDLKNNGNVPTNSTNKISFGYPYRYLTQNSIFNINNWETIFNNNQLNLNSMFNVFGNVNLSSINNTPFINCIANDQPSPYEVINVCIGSNISRAGYLLNVEGNAYFSSNIFVQSNVFAFGTIGNVSDIRIKDNLKIISDPINKINLINGYTYTRRDTGKIESGLVAQEVLKILPEVVNMNNDLYNISYGNLSGLLVEGIKELNMRLKSIEDLLKSSNLSNNP